MNKKRILMVANAIKNRKFKTLGFNMSCYIGAIGDIWCNAQKDHSGSECGTVACIAGWAVALMKGVKTLKGIDSNRVPDLAADWLDLTPKEREALFVPGRIVGTLDSKTQDHAIATLELFAETGVVNWAQAKRNIVAVSA